MLPCSEWDHLHPETKPQIHAGISVLPCNSSYRICKSNSILWDKLKKNFKVICIDVYLGICAVFKIPSTHFISPLFLSVLWGTSLHIQQSLCEGEVNGK